MFFNTKIALLAFPLMMTSAIAYSAETINTFDALQQAIKDNKSDITISDNIEFTGNAPISLGDDSGTSSVLTIDGEGHSFSGHMVSANKATSEAFNIKKGGSLTLKNITVKDFVGSPGLATYSSIMNWGGTLTLTAEEGKNVVFEHNNVDRRGGGGDISLFTNDSQLIIDGTGGEVALKTGIYGREGTITHKGQSTLVLEGTNSSFSGSFSNESGLVRVGEYASFFNGNNTFTGGSLEWNSSRTLYPSLTLKSGTALTVGETGSLILANKSVSLAEDVSIENNGKLVLSDYSGKGLSLKKQITGSGKLTLKNTSLTINGEQASASGNNNLNVVIDEHSNLKGTDFSFASLVNDGNIYASKLHVSGSGNVVDNENSISTEELISSGTILNGGIINSTDISTSGDIENNKEASLLTTNLTAQNVKNAGTIEASNITTNQNFVNEKEADLSADQKITVGGNFENSGMAEVSDLTVSGTLTNNQSATLTVAGGSLKDVVNEGTLSNTKEMTITGSVSGAGSVFNSSHLTLNGDGSSLSGTYTQTNGKTTIKGKAFGGLKDIQAGTLDIISDEMYKGKVQLGKGAGLNVSLEAEVYYEINKDVLSFIQDSKVNFTGLSYDENLFRLSDDIQNTSGNEISFNKTSLLLNGTNYDYAAFKIKDSVLNLASSGEKDGIGDYTLHNFSAENSFLDLNLELSGKEMTADHLTFTGDSEGSLTLRKVYISDNEGEADSFVEVIKNQDKSQVSLGTEDDEKLHVASNFFEYTLEVDDDGRTINLLEKKSSKNGLFDMNEQPEERDFYTNGKYDVSTDLGETAFGEFNVYGFNKDPQTDILEGNGHSLFKLKEKEVHLEVSNLTIQNADTSEGEQGSVLKNTSASSRAEFTNDIIQDNGGNAIYNDAGSKENGTGVYVYNSTFKNNTVDGKGGAVYNDTEGFLFLENVSFLGDEVKEGLNDIYNNGKAEISGKNTFESLITNDGELTFSNLSDSQVRSIINNDNATLSVKDGMVSIQNLENTGAVQIESGNVVLNTVSGTGKIQEEGNLTLQGDASGFTGTFDQKGGLTTVTQSASFFGGESTITGGTFWWLANEEALSADAKLTITGDDTWLFVGSESGKEKEAAINASLKLQNGNSVDSKVHLASGSVLTVAEQGSLTVKDGSVWNGEINVSGGDLTINAADNHIQTETSVLNATSGTVKLEQGSLLINENGMIDEAVAFSENQDTTLVVNGGTVSLNNNDTLNGTTVLSAGTLNYGSVSTNETSSLLAESGNLNLQSAQLTLDGSKNNIADAVNVNIDDNSTVSVVGGTLTVDEQDVWNGEIDLNENGTLNYRAHNNGILNAENGTLNLQNGSELNFKGTTIKKAVALNIESGSKLNIMPNGDLTIDDNDTWNGLITNNGGTLTVSGVDNTNGLGGQLAQISGQTVLNESSHILIAAPDTSINGGSLSVLDNSTLTFADGDNIKLDSLTVGGHSSLSIQNGIAQTVKANTLTVDGQNDFALDVQANGGMSDQFVVSHLISQNGGVVNVSDFGFITVPTSKQVDMQFFDAETIDDNITFTATDKTVSTPLGDYSLQSLGKGAYRATLGAFNPDVYRGQASTLAMYNNQLSIDDMILNHIILQNGFGQQAAAQSKANKSRLNRDGGWWSKAYYNDGSLDMSHNLDVDTKAYGVFIGADLPMINLNCGWNFIPSFFAGYTGSKQDYNDVKMKQNGGQGGVMGTFTKGDFVSSLMVYGGGYSNKMEGRGYKDSVNNWFVGTAAKAAYNVHVADEVVVQPTAFVAYNSFGKQDWHTSYGNINMETDTLNGFSVAPGINFIYAPKTWSAYTTFQYVYNIDNKVGGHAGTDIDLPTLKTDNGFFQYGVGATKSWNERLNSDFRVTAESGGRTGVGFRLGVEYLFDTKNWFK